MGVAITIGFRFDFDSTAVRRAFDCSSKVIDGQAYAWTWTFSVFTQNRFIGPRTAKSQPIWIKFCTHILLYGTHLWANFDRDQRVDGSRTNQNDCFFVILVTHPKYRDDGSPRFRRQTVNSGGDDGCYREKFRNFVAWAEPDPKNSIFRFYGTLRLSCAQPTENSFTPNQWYPWKAETPKVYFC